MQSKEETRNETVRKRNCGNKQAEHDEALSVVWDESIEAGRQITEEYREGREKVMEYKDFVEQVKEQIQDFLPEKFADATVSVHQVVKNNDCVLDGLTIRTEESNISPIRSCEDVDEAALTYAEVKALATGNPYIKEKMDLDIQVLKLKLMKANHTSQKYRLEDNIAKHYPQQITILKERISGMQADIQTAKANLPVDKEQFSMKVGDKLFTDKKEAGTALVEMCKEIKTVNAPAVIGEYAGFKMAVSFDAFNHKFVMNLKGQLSHNLEVGSDPLGNISRINHALESMPKQLMEAQTKLETVEHQLETAKVEVTKPFAQEAELAEKLERLSALNALLNMDEKGNDGIDMDDEPEAPKNEKEVADRPAKNIPLAEKTVGTGQDKGIRQYADAPAERVSLKAKLEVMKAKVAGGDTEKPMPLKAKGKEETL